MKLEEMAALWEKFGDDEYGEFCRVELKRSQWRDVHAFLLLQEIMPPTPPKKQANGKVYHGDVVSAAEHDQIWLAIDCEKLADVITEAQVLELSRCGVMYESDTSSLSMFA